MALKKYRDYDKYVLKFFYEVNKPMHRKDTYDKLKVNDIIAELLLYPD